MKQKEHMKKGSTRDPNGRLDGHMRESDNRAKSKHDWVSEYESELEDFADEQKLIKELDKLGL